jgi:3-hydroxyacyl-[acyl-carrier-protein] dehydratase
MASMDIQEILKWLPHRYPFLLIDRVVEFTLGKSLVAIKNVSFNEPFFVGHFPNQPVMPGVLILEALAQATCVLANKSFDDGPNSKLYLFAGIDNARFKQMVKPGDQLKLEVELVKSKQGIFKFKGVASVDGQLACTADMISAKKDITSRD